MFRTLTALLLVLSILGIATGGLLRPCDCAPPSPAPAAASCCTCHDAEPAAPPAPDAFRICKRGPQPSTSPSETVQLPAPDVHDVLLGIEEGAPAPLLALTGAREEHRPPGDPAWSRSPAGLSRFLI